jgi:hypothetical protein
MIKDKDKCEALLFNMKAISEFVWKKIGKNQYGELTSMPIIDGKQGGNSGTCYYSSPIKVAYRYDVWNKMSLAERRLLAIHELYHAVTRHRKSKRNIDSMFGLTELAIYKDIYGEDSELYEYNLNTRAMLKEVIYY